ncbi:AEC family transporter [Breoghania sp. L-A4]|uniref:AEC family transporter n=1 Tax=Breoghania sp. L-A4 TaxID=2304600 RepID=UPI001967B23A|nr:AEC family transporter [Breoghania sp. L-A4]
MISYDIVAVVLPIFALIVFGFGAAVTKLLNESVGDALGQFVYVIAIPLLVFRTLATASFDGASPWALWAAYFSGVAIIWATATLLSRRIFRREARYGVIGGISAGFANTVLVGIPVVSATFGDTGLVPLFVILSVHLPVMTIASTILMERAAVTDGTEEPKPLLQTLIGITRNLLVNPLVIGILAGAAWRTAGLPLTGLPADAIGKIANAAIPVALFSLGMSLRRYGIRGNLAPAIVMTALKIVGLPVIVYLLTLYVFKLPPLWVQVATLTAACPTGINAYLFATRFGTGHALSSNTITLSTGGAVLSIGLWMKFLGVM